jgi:membrane-associated protein
MELVLWFIDQMLHFDKQLEVLQRDYGVWTYAFLFVIVFCETGLIVTPFLPGDSLLFAAGALAATGVFSLPTLLMLFAVAAILGDFVNYAMGYRFGERILAMKKIPFVKRKHIDRTRDFFARYGNKTIVLARFVPIVRTFAPFVAGIGQMSYQKFMAYNFVGGIVWVLSCTFAGYVFGNIPWVKGNFSIVVLGIVFVSVLPMVFEFWQAYRRKKATPAVTESAQ